MVPQPRSRGRISPPLHRGVLGVRRVLPDLRRDRAAEPVSRAPSAGPARRGRAGHALLRARTDAASPLGARDPRVLLRTRGWRSVGPAAPLAQRGALRRERSTLRKRCRLLLLHVAGPRVPARLGHRRPPRDRRGCRRDLRGARCDQRCDEHDHACGPWRRRPDGARPRSTGARASLRTRRSLPLAHRHGIRARSVRPALPHRAGAHRRRVRERQRARPRADDPVVHRRHRRAGVLRERIRANGVGAGGLDRAVVRRDRACWRRVPGGRAELRRGTRRAEQGACVHRAEHRGDARRVLARQDRRVAVQRGRHAEPVGGDSRVRRLALGAALGLPPPAVGLRSAAGAAPVLRLHRRRRRPLRHRRSRGAHHAVGARAQHRVPVAADVGEPPPAVHARLRRGDDAGRRGRGRGPSAVPGEGHPTAGRAEDRRAAHLLRRADQRLRDREQRGRGVRLPAGGHRRPHALFGQGRRRHQLALGPAPVHAALRRDEPDLQRSDPVRQPHPVPPQHLRAREAHRAVPRVRQGSVPRCRGRQALVDQRRIHRRKPLPL